jgi:cation diffusion facilitator family transporter
LWIVLGLNLLVASTKLVVGYMIGALALSADGLHSALDASSNVIGLIGMRLARQPPDAGHPYGHQRFETLAALGIGLLIGFGFLGVAQEFVGALLHGRPPPEVTPAAVAVVVATVLINVGISRYEVARGRALGSSILAADAAHTMTDSFAAGAVLVGFGLVSAGFAWGDLLATFVVSVLIARTAWAVLRTNVGVLADEASLDPERVRSIVLGVPGVRGTHRVRSRGSADHVHVDLHIHLEPTLPLVDAHDKSHEVARAIQAALPQVMDVVIHVEPADGREKSL